MMYARSVTVGILLATFAHASQGMQNPLGSLAGFLEEPEEKVAEQVPLKPGYEMEILMEHIDELIANDDTKNKYGDKYIYPDRVSEGEIEKMLEDVKVIGIPLELAKITGTEVLKDQSWHEGEVMFRPHSIKSTQHVDNGTTRCVIRFQASYDVTLELVIFNSEKEGHRACWNLTDYEQNMNVATFALTQGLANPEIKSKELHKSFMETFGHLEEKTYNDEKVIYHRIFDAKNSSDFDKPSYVIKDGEAAQMLVMSFIKKNHIRLPVAPAKPSLKVGTKVKSHWQSRTKVSKAVANGRITKMHPGSNTVDIRFDDGVEQYKLDMEKYDVTPVVDLNMYWMPQIDLWRFTWPILPKKGCEPPVPPTTE